jgi:hypothetical protein
MTESDQVRGLIDRLSPDAVCDDCIADRLQLADRKHAGVATRELAGSAGFVRSKGVCALCGGTKLVTFRRGR